MLALRYRNLCRVSSKVFLMAIAIAISASSNLVFSQVDPESRPPTQELLPETTVMFIQVDNFRDMMEKMAETNFAKMMRDEAVSPLVDGLWEEAKTAYQDVRDDVGLDIEDFTALPKGEMTFAIIAPRRKKPEFFLLLELEDEGEALNNVLDRTRNLIETEGDQTIEKETSDDGIEYEAFNDDEGNRITFFRKDGLLVGCSSKDELDAFVDRWMEREVEKVRPLSQNRKFVTIMNHCLGTNELRPEARFFVDPIGLVKSSMQGNFQANLALNFLPVLGLDGLSGFGGSMLLSEEDYEVIYHAHMLLANPRNGIFEMIAMKPTMYEPEPWIPENAISYMTTSWDVDQILSELTKMIENFYEEGYVDEAIEKNINEEVGFDLKEDVLAHLSGRATMSQWIQEPIKATSQMTIISVEVTNLEKFEESLEMVIARINQEEEGEENDEDEEGAIVEKEYKGVRYWTTQNSGAEERIEERRERRRKRAEERGEEFADMDIDIPQPAWALVGDYLLFSFASPEAIKAAIDTDQGDAGALVNAPEYEEISETMNKFLKNEMPCAIFYSNPVEQFRWMHTLAYSEDTKKFMDVQAKNMENKYLDGFKKRFDENPLPDFDKLEKYFSPSGSIITDDDTGFHFLIFQKRHDPEEKAAASGK